MCHVKTQDLSVTLAHSKNSDKIELSDQAWWYIIVFLRKMFSFFFCILYENYLLQQCLVRLSC